MMELTLDKPRIVMGTSRGLMQQALVANLYVRLPFPIAGLATWIDSCIPKLRNIAHPLSTQNLSHQELDTDDIAYLITWLSSALQHYLKEPVEWGVTTKLHDSAFNSNEDISHEARQLILKKTPGEHTAATIHLIGYYELALPFHKSEISHSVLDIAQRVIQEGMTYFCAEPSSDLNQSTTPVRQWVNSQLTHLKKHSLHESTAALLRTAEQKNIPWLHLIQNVYQIGYGCKARKITRANFTDRTSKIATRMAHAKALSTTVLLKGGLPVLRKALVSHSIKQCLDIAENLGYPVLAKTVTNAKNKSLPIKIETQEKLLEAYEHAKEYGLSIEKQITGKHYQLLVIEKRLFSAMHLAPMGVVADGQHTIQELVEHTNITHSHQQLAPLVIDNKAIKLLTKSGLTPEATPPLGQFIRLRNTTKSQGNERLTEDVTNNVHPDNCLMAERAARMIGLDSVGIHFITEDISRSYLEIGGYITEVNDGSGFSNLQAENLGRNYEDEAVERLLGHSDGRIPIVALAGAEDKTAVSYLLRHILSAQKTGLGMSTPQEVWMGESIVSTDHLSGYQGGWILLTDPTIETAIIELPHQGLMNDGCPFDRCDVVALLDVPHATQCHIEKDVAERAQHTIVANAEHPLSMHILTTLPPKQTLFIAQTPTHNLIQHHIKENGIAVVGEEQNGKFGAVIYRNKQSEWIMAINEMIAITTTAHANVIDALFAITLAYAMNCSLDQIRTQLATPARV